VSAGTPRTRGRSDGRRSCRRVGLPLALLALGAVLALVPWPATWVERAFSRGLFPLTSHVLAPIVSAAAFSLTGLLALAVVAALLVGLLVDRRGAGSRRRLTCVWLPWLAAVLLSGFMLTWGLAYRRDTLASLIGVPSTPPTPAQTAAAQAELLAVLRGAAASPTPDAADIAAAAECVGREVARLTGTRVDVPTRVKWLPAGTLLRAGFAGVTSPWLLEPHVDAGLPPVARLATATHELTHAAGFAREADTDAVAVLAGIRCADPAVRYALALHALSSLAAGMAPDAAAALVNALPPRARGDLQALDSAVARYRLPWLQRATDATYGTYLRSRGVRGGMADYGRAITLVVQALTRPARPSPLPAPPTHHAEPSPHRCSCG